MRHLINGTDHKHSKSCCDQSSPARRTMKWKKIWVADEFQRDSLYSMHSVVVFRRNEYLFRVPLTHWPQRDVDIIFTRGQFWPSGIVVACVCLSVCASVCVCVRQPWACPCHKSPRVQARTTKFGQKVQNNLVKVPIVFGGDCPWPSRSNLTWKAKFTPFWACPRHNSSSIEVRTTKFEQKMQTNLLVVHIVLEGDWLRPSWSNLTR